MSNFTKLTEHGNKMFPASNGMKKYILGLFLAGLVFVGSGVSAHATTSQELQGQVDALMASVQLQQLQAKVASILEQVQVLPSTTVAELTVKVNLLTVALKLQQTINSMIVGGQGRVVTYNTNPVITSVAPASGAPGTKVAISGRNIRVGDTVFFRGAGYGQCCDRTYKQGGATIIDVDNTAVEDNFKTGEATYYATGYFYVPTTVITAGGIMGDMSAAGAQQPVAIPTGVYDIAIVSRTGNRESNHKTFTVTAGQEFCMQVITRAKNTTTGEIKDFTTSCLPDGWVVWDDTLPDAPFGLTATALSPTSVFLNWYNSTGRYAFRIVELIGNQKYDLTLSPDKNYTINNLTPGSTHTYSVYACADALCNRASGGSSWATVTLPTVGLPNTAPVISSSQTAVQIGLSEQLVSYQLPYQAEWTNKLYRSDGSLYDDDMGGYTAGAALTGATYYTYSQSYFPDGVPPPGNYILKLCNTSGTICSNGISFTLTAADPYKAFISNVMLADSQNNEITSLVPGTTQRVRWFDHHNVFTGRTYNIQLNKDGVRYIKLGGSVVGNRVYSHTPTHLYADVAIPSNLPSGSYSISVGITPYSNNSDVTPDRYNTTFKTYTVVGTTTTAPWLGSFSLGSNSNWAVGTSHTFTWSATSLPSDAKIHVTYFDANSQASASYPTTITQLDITATSYTWTLPSTLQPGHSYAMRLSVINNNGVVADTEGSGQPRSERTFTVPAGTAVTSVSTLSADKTSGPAPLTVNFTETATNALLGCTPPSFIFGDGETYTLAGCALGDTRGTVTNTKSHTYTTPGTYQATAHSSAPVTITVTAPATTQTNALPVLNASGSRPSTNSVQLTWNRDTSSTMADAGYVVYRKTSDSLTDTSTGGYHLSAGVTTFVDDGSYSNSAYYSTSGFIPSGVPVPNQTYYYWIYAKGPNNTNNSTPVKVVVSGVADPTLDFTSNTASVTAGNTVTLTWSSAGIPTSGTPCYATGPSGASEWLGAKASSGSATITVPASAPAGTRIYALSCTAGNGINVGKTLNIQVTAPVVLAPTINTFTATPGSLTLTGGNVTLAWTTSNVNTNACNVVSDATHLANWGLWSTGANSSASVTINGSGSATNASFTLTCSGASGTTPATRTLLIPLGNTQSSAQSQTASSLNAIRALLEAMKASLSR